VSTAELTGHARESEWSAHDVDLDADGPIERARARRRRGLASREVWPSAIVAVGFVAAAGACIALLPRSGGASVPVALALVVAYALAFRFEFEVGSGSAVPTQVLLVPILFALPLGLVPAAVGVAVLAGAAIDAAQGRAHLHRVPLRVANAWYVVGPVAVLGAAHEWTPAISHWPLYAAALAAQFVLDFVPAALRGALTLGVKASDQLRAMRPVWTMDVALSSIGLAVAIAGVQTQYAFVLALPLLALLAFFSRERRARIDHALELSHAYRGTAFLLGDVIEADDAYTGSHSRDVVDLTLAVSDRLGLDARRRRDAEFVALLHDVGKVRVPNEIINKPGPLTPEEREVMNGHTIAGQEMLEQIGGLLGNVGAVVRSCHEHYDGNGYPDGLAGDEIPLLARIVSCCDAFNAMTSDRSYRKAMPIEEALDELRRHSGTQFDPRVVDALAASIT
jgi:HD-GYP domain-containing protein (c-di-GMP phosphodiesterase class II)